MSSPGLSTIWPNHAQVSASALGRGLTNECNLACAFCYRDPSRVDLLTLEQVQKVMASIPVRLVNLGTGENGLHPEFLEILKYLRTQPIKLTMTSNGYSLVSLADDDLAAFKDIEFSLGYPTEAEQDHRREPGNWQLRHEQAARCRRLGVPVTFIAVMMQSNYDRLAAIADIAKSYDAPLRINVHQSVRIDKFALTYEQYWVGFKALFDLSLPSVSLWSAPWPVCSREPVDAAWQPCVSPRGRRCSPAFTGWRWRTTRCPVGDTRRRGGLAAVCRCTLRP